MPLALDDRRTARSKHNITQSSIKLSDDMVQWELTTIDRQELKLADYGGKILVINLFAPWCDPCRLNLKALNKLERRYKKRGVELFALVTSQNDPHIDSVRDFARLMKIKCPVIWDDVGFSESLVKIVQRPGILPQTFVVDKDHRIVKHFIGFNKSKTGALMRQSLEELRKPNGN